MWLYRGAQSAVFYYASCTPCALSVDRRKRKKDAVRARRLNAQYDAQYNAEIVSDQPRPFPQPTPFSTNEGWREEIALGPGPPTRRGGNRISQRTDSWNTDQSLQSKKDKNGKSTNPLGERWNRMRYQREREDEPLWGQQEVRGSSIGFSGRGRAGPSDTPKYYACVPPVNDLHPPIVSGPRSRAETRWMLQPPPTAKAMLGKESFDSSPRESVGAYPGDRLSRNVAPLDPCREDIFAERISDDPAVDTDAIHEQLPQRPSVTRVRDHSDSLSRDDLELSRLSQTDSMLSITNTDDQSLSASWKYPETPSTRPASKSTDENDKAPQRPQISKTLSTLQRPSNKQKVHLLHLELNDENRDEVGLGQLERIRPWRWSMDI